MSSIRSNSAAFRLFILCENGSVLMEKCNLCMDFDVGWWWL